MSLTPGGRLGPYEITGAIGAGGMGEVYRGRDATLNRDAAIKVLPAAMASDPHRLARFKREAQVLAALNHPNIAQVYGFDGAPLADGTTAHFLAMELVEGEDLAARLRRGAVAVDEAIGIARQIVDGLEEAHEHGIIHRDLKPANVKVTPEGKVKILDFGLAKALDDDPSSSGANSQMSHSPTLSRHMTEAGMIMGTAAYMSPEQARGKKVDKRSDIWAFGVLLFEMLTGERLFGGETVSDVLAAVLTREPNLSALPAATPPSVRRLLGRCLEKDPRKRLRDIGDARPAFDRDEKDAEAGVAASPARARGPGAFLPWLVAGASLIALTATLARRTPSPIAAPVSFSVLPEGDLAGLTAANPVLSSDGTFLVYEARGLYLRRLSDIEARELPGTIGGSQPFLSPDGKWVGFYRGDKIRKVAVAGGEPVDITVARSGPGAAFVSNERILFTPGWVLAPLMSVGADGGPVTQASTLDTSTNERGHWWPHALPDGRHVLFTVWYAGPGLQAAKIAVLDLQTGAHRVLFPGAMAQYGDGHVLFYRAGQYHVMPFDPVKLAATGESRPVLPEAFEVAANGDALDPVSLSPTGSVAYMAGRLNSPRTLTWLERGGKQTPLPLTLTADGVSLSPNDSQIAVGRPEGGGSHISIYDVSGTELARLSGEAYNWGPIWHPDGRRVAYTSMKKGEFDVAVQAPGGPPEAAAEGEIDEESIDWLPDGRLLVNESERDATTSISYSTYGGHEHTPLIRGLTSLKDGGRVSPDGRWLAICSDLLGAKSYVFVRSLTGPGELQRVTPAGPDCNLAWSAGTHELMVGRATSVAALSWQERGGQFVVTRETEFAPVTFRTRIYAMARDGKRLLVGIIPASVAIGRGLNIHVGPVSTWSEAPR